MESEERKSEATSSAAEVWDARWIRFRAALTIRGVEPHTHDFCRGWILAWLKFIKPKKFFMASMDDVREFVTRDISDRLGGTAEIRNLKAEICGGDVGTIGRIPMLRLGDGCHFLNFDLRLRLRQLR